MASLRVYVFFIMICLQKVVLGSDNFKVPNNSWPLVEFESNVPLTYAFIKTDIFGYFKLISKNEDTSKKNCMILNYTPEELFSKNYKITGNFVLKICSGPNEKIRWDQLNEIIALPQINYESDKEHELKKESVLTYTEKNFSLIKNKYNTFYRINKIIKDSSPKEACSHSSIKYYQGTIDILSKNYDFMKIITPKWERSFSPVIDGESSFQMIFKDWDCINQFLIYQFNGWEDSGIVYLDLLNGSSYNFDIVTFDGKSDKDIDYKYINKMYWNDKKSFFISPHPLNDESGTGGIDIYDCRTRSAKQGCILLDSKKLGLDQFKNGAFNIVWRNNELNFTGSNKIYSTDENGMHENYTFKKVICSLQNEVTCKIK